MVLERHHHRHAATKRGVDWGWEALGTTNLEISQELVSSAHHTTFLLTKTHINRKPAGAKEFGVQWSGVEWGKTTMLRPMEVQSPRRQDTRGSGLPWRRGERLQRRHRSTNNNESDGYLRETLSLTLFAGTPALINQPMLQLKYGVATHMFNPPPPAPSITLRRFVERKERRKHEIFIRRFRFTCLPGSELRQRGVPHIRRDAAHGVLDERGAVALEFPQDAFGLWC